MQQKMAHLREIHAAIRAKRAQIFRRSGNGEFIDLLAVHKERGRGGLRGIGAVARCVIRVQNAGIAGSVHQKAGVLAAGRDHRCRRAVAKEHAGCAIRPVYHAAGAFCGHDENVLAFPAFQISFRHLQGIEKACAGAVEIDAGARRADFALNDAGKRRSQIRIYDIGAEDIVHLPGAKPGLFRCV